jgi:cystathionine gamma-lyase
MSESHSHSHNDHAAWGFGTKVIHVGQDPDPHTGAVITPISLSTTFAQKSPGVKYPGGYEYARSANPTRDAFEAALAAAEGGKHGFSFGSGLGCTTTLMHLMAKGDHVLVIDDVYGGTQRLFRRCMAEFGMEFSFVDMPTEDSVANAIKPNTKMIWIETPTNPTLKLVDIAMVAKVAHAHANQILVVVDNTFASPYGQNPLSLGADIAMHSVTKYIGGHSDVVMGACVCIDDQLASRIRFFQNALGATPSPFDAYLALRGLKTLHLRMKESAKNALACARMMEAHPAVEKVIYPGLPSHPQHELAKKQMKSFGGMITVVLRGGLGESKKFLETLRFFALAESLGGVESLAEHPAIMTHASVPAEHRKTLGISDSLVRLSCGIEDEADLVADLKHALDSVSNL